MGSGVINSVYNRSHTFSAARARGHHATAQRFVGVDLSVPNSAAGRGQIKEEINGTGKRCSSTLTSIEVIGSVRLVCLCVSGITDICWKEVLGITVKSRIEPRGFQEV